MEPSKYADLYSANPYTATVALVGHELVHVQQYASYGDEFGREYLKEALWKFATGRDGYEDNKYEAPAFEKGDEIGSDLDKRFRDGRVNCDEACSAQ